MNDFKKVQHGFMEHPKNKQWSHTRKCHIHGHHGPFYVCSYYSRQLKNKIIKMAAKWRKNPQWRVINNE